MAFLYVVATPIGNLEDITFRAIKVLKDVDVIACEDTRVSKKLLNHFGITGKKLISYHDFNEEKEIPHIISLLKKGKSVALISDAGTPTLSDPGYKLVKKVWEEGFKVIPIPGAFAAATALSASGLPTDKFLFLGFLPNKDRKREETLLKYLPLEITLIIYESPKRVIKTLKLIEKLAPNSQIVVAKELTKINEQFFRGTASQVISSLEKDLSLLKGEFIILIHPIWEKRIDEKDINLFIKERLKQGLKSKEIAKLVSSEFGISKNEAYALVIKQKK